MIWRDAAEFWAMGGYGAYVWGSMGVTLALLALELWWLGRGRQQALDAVCEALDAAALDDGPAPTLATASARAAVQPHAQHTSEGLP